MDLSPQEINEVMTMVGKGRYADVSKVLSVPNYQNLNTTQRIEAINKYVSRNYNSENEIFQGRFIHVMELQRLGAKISIKDSTAIIEGNTNFIGAEVMSSDLRASAALVLAGIISKGQTTISRIYHLDRGYEKIENKLKKIGVRIKRLS